MTKKKPHTQQNHDIKSLHENAKIWTSETDINRERQVQRSMLPDSRFITKLTQGSVVLAKGKT